MESTIIKLICAHNGSMDFDDLGANTAFDISHLNFQHENFHIVEFNGRKKVIARTKIRQCKAKDCQSCNNLHLCKFFLFGNCKNSNGRRRCFFCHDLKTEHNTAVLREHNLQELDRSELCTLLLQNDTSLLPPVCISYNEGSGEYGLCPEQMSCRRLHICDKYIRGTCSSGGNCSRSHDFFEPHPLKTLEERGIPVHLINSMYSVYQNIRALKYNNNQRNDQRQRQKQPADPGKSTCEQVPYVGPERTEICIYYIKGSCRYRERCRKVHFNMPYKWEVKTSQGWSTLPDNEEVEKDYCNPAKIYSRSLEPVCFDTMTQGLSKVRRLSTMSSLRQPNLFLTTEWVWYWEDEYGNWVLYASSAHGHQCSSTSSEDLEQKYQSNSTDVVQFKAGSQTYELSFQDMLQINRNYGTKKLVRRRPVFVSAADVQDIKTSKRPLTRQPISKALPEHWDRSLVQETGYRKVVLTQSTKEYKEIQALFRNTMLGFSISQIERVQNKALWEVFQWQKNLMMKNNGGKECEKLLFHGTDSRHIEAICQQNFDWRICGTHGTAYGKGSYFARDAKYSHSYTSSSGPRTMFVCRVLVGEYTNGGPDYRRPPSKDGGDVNFYDSCVDNVKNPSIFVVFEKHQVYPEYLIQYYEDGFPPSHRYTYSSRTSNTTPQQTPNPPRPASYSPSYTTSSGTNTYSNLYAGPSSTNTSNSDSTLSCVIS